MWFHFRERVADRPVEVMYPQEADKGMQVSNLFLVNFQNFCLPFDQEFGVARAL